jgi:hypothetical protein
VERVHPEQITSRIEAFAAGDLAYVEALLHYGPRYLTEAELTTRREQVFEAYYRGLGGALLKMKGSGFWAFQRSRLAEMGCRLTWPRVVRAAVAEAVAEAKNPMAAMQKFRAVLSGRPGR